MSRRPDKPNGRHQFYTSARNLGSMPLYPGSKTMQSVTEVGWKCALCEQYTGSKKHHNLGPCPGRPLTADELALRKPASVEAAHGVL